jgi:putative NIF3 family GTP cyclohydrolase 1 type 2
MGGSGGNDVKMVRNEGADVYVTGEIKHSQAIEAIHLGLAVIEAGHYETERVVLPSVIYRLQTLTDGVQYKLACYDASPFWSL